MKPLYLISILGAALFLSLTACHDDDLPIDPLQGKSVVGFSAEAPGDTVLSFTAYCYLDSINYLSTVVTRQQHAWTYAPARPWPETGTLIVRAYATNPSKTHSLTATDTIPLPVSDPIIHLTFK